MAESSWQAGPVQPAPSAPPPALAGEALSFTGKASEYFRIWAVNLFLTIITLGLYSPWAKVRRLKYLYRNTHLAGGSFDYHANPVAILKGRLIAVALLLCSSLASQVSFFLGIAIGGVLFLIYPWILVRSRMFSLRNTSYRNIRFGFAPVYGEAYRVVFGGGLLAVGTLGVAIPYVRYLRACMQVNYSRFGSLDMRLHNSTGPGKFYGIYFLTIFCFVIIVFSAMTIAVIAAIAITEAAGAEDAETGLPASVRFFLSLIFPLMYLAIFLAMNDAINRMVIRGIRIGGHAMRCSWSIARLFVLRFTNLAAILLSLGLLIPWATIRMHRYRVANLAVSIRGSLEEVVAVQQEDVSALGDEVGDAFDYDLGF